MDDIEHAVAANVRAELARRRTRHSDVAAALGITAGTLSRKLTGKVGISLTDLYVIANHLGAKPSEFLPSDVPTLSRAA